MEEARLSPAEPITQLRHIPIRECGEPLVDFLAHCPGLRLDRPRFRYRRATFLRQRVAEMLCEANARLPKGIQLAIVEGWRPLHIQHRMYLSVWEQFRTRHPHWSDTQLKRVVNRYTAPLHLRVPPPHSTGGAVDVMLADSAGVLLDHYSPFEAFDAKGFSLHAPGLSEAARRTRAILAEALGATGLTNYPSEYWHWSFGDQGWAYRGRHAHALYGPIEPPGYVPPPEDVRDAPLELEPFQFLSET